MKRFKQIVEKRFLLVGIFIIILLFFMYEYSTMNIPLSVPNLIIEVNGEKFTAIKNEYNWSNFKQSNSNLGDYAIETAKKINPHKVHECSDLKLTLSSDKNIKSFKVKQVIGTNKNNYVLKDVNLTNNIIKIPEKTGEYIYYIYAEWDENHFAEYIIKVIAEE